MQNYPSGAEGFVLFFLRQKSRGMSAAFDKTNTTRHTQINGFTGEKMAEFENTTHMLTALGVDHNIAHRVSGKRVWLTYVSKDDLHRKRLRFVNHEIMVDKTREKKNRKPGGGLQGIIIYKTKGSVSLLPSTETAKVTKTGL